MGDTGLLVSRLCFGTLTMSPLQVNLAPEEGAELLAEAYRCGVNFWDTAELYNNYPYLRLAARKIGDELIIATKAFVYSREGAAHSLEEARRELDMDVVSIFLLHEQESVLTLQGHKPALDFLVEAKYRGLVRAVGISCHTVAAVRAAIDFGCIDVIHPVVNIDGIGIKDGSLEDMLHELGRARHRGVGVYAMKVLGGGHLAARAEECVQFVKGLSCVHSFAIGLSSLEELQANLCYLDGDAVPAAVAARLAQKKRRLLVEDCCDRCGSCVEKCPQEALSLPQAGEGKVEVDAGCCVFCGYCGSFCPQFCLKII